MTANTLHFTKMHGLGNDFIIIDAINQQVNPSSFPIRKLADRHTGIGFDQALILEKTDSADFFCRIFNADGSEASQCGNGLRCVAKYAHDQGLCHAGNMEIATLSGKYTATIEKSGLVTVEMGMPSFPASPPSITYLDELTINHPMLVSVGNPHLILISHQISDSDFRQSGAALSSHDDFSDGINVGFMEIVTRNHIKLRTYERGSGETLACGSNACAAVAAGISRDLLDAVVTVELALGNLDVSWKEKNRPILLTGPASYAYRGYLND